MILVQVQVSLLFKVTASLLIPLYEKSDALNEMNCTSFLKTAKISIEN